MKSTSSKQRSDKVSKPKSQSKPKGQSLKVEPTSGRLYVGNLDYGVEDEDLVERFGAVGTVVSASVVRHGGSKRSKGFAFVEMSNVDEAKEAISVLNDQDLKGRSMLVSGAKAEKPRRDEKPGRERSPSGGKSRERRDSKPKERKPKFDGENDPRKVSKQKIEIVSGPVVTLSGLNSEATEEDVSDLFDQIGSIQSREALEGKSGEFKVTLSDVDEAQRAVEFLDGKSFMGQRLRVVGLESGEPATVTSDSAAEGDTVPEGEES